MIQQSYVNKIGISRQTVVDNLNKSACGMDRLVFCPDFRYIYIFFPDSRYIFGNQGSLEYWLFFIHWFNTENTSNMTSLYLALCSFCAFSAAWGRWPGGSSVWGPKAGAQDEATGPHTEVQVCAGVLPYEGLKVWELYQTWVWKCVILPSLPTMQRGGQHLRFNQL